MADDISFADWQPLPGAETGTSSSIYTGTAAPTPTETQIRQVLRSPLKTLTVDQSMLTIFIWWQTADLDDSTLLGYYTKPYLAAHELSWPSYRYLGFFWMIMAALLVFGSIWHVLTRRGGGTVGTTLNKYSMKQLILERKTNKSGKTRGKSYSSPTLGQSFGLVVLFLLAFLLCYIGPDYIDPRTCTFGGECKPASSSGPPKTTFAPGSKRDTILSSYPDTDESAMNRLFPRQGLNPGGWAPWMDPNLSSPNTEQDKLLWTSASRLGAVSYAMFPLCVLLALKLWPFNIFATPFLTDWAYNKTGFFHRWFGRVIFILSTIHVALWSVQLFRDSDPFGRASWYPVWDYWRFQAGVVAYVAICAMMVLSLEPFRKRFYEITYYLHAALAVALLVGSALHFKTLAPYCWIALGLWGGERVCRLALWFYINGSPFKKLVLRPTSDSSSDSEKPHQRDASRPESAEIDEAQPSEADYFRADYVNQYSPERSESELPPLTPPQHQPSLPQTPSMTRHSLASEADFPQEWASPTLAGSEKHLNAVAAAAIRPTMFDWRSIPSGYALAEALPGKTIRLQLHVPHRIAWRTGQHVSLTIPSLRFWQGHPFTICSADDRITKRSQGFKNGGSYVQVLARVKGGFTKALWNKITGLTEASPAPVLLRTQIGWPMGSNKGSRIQDYSTVVIVCGGSGITFGMAVFEHACWALARKLEGNVKVNRVHLVWLLRDFAHITWVAPEVHRCLQLVGLRDVTVQFLVTQASSEGQAALDEVVYDRSFEGAPLAPPRPTFMRNESSKQSMESSGSVDSAGVPQASAETDAVGLSDVEFDGEEEGLDAGEQRLNQQVKKTGTIKRAKSRKDKDKKQAIRAHNRQSDATLESYNYPQPQSIVSASMSSPRTSTFNADRRGSFASSLNLNLNEPEETALNALAEYTHSCKNPDIRQLLADEVNSSGGKVMIAACGPPALNAKLRKWTTELISPAKVWKGDQSGQVDLFLEDFA